MAFKTHKRAISLTESVIKMADELMEPEGVTTLSELVRIAIKNLYKKEFPKYLAPKQPSSYSPVTRSNAPEIRSEEEMTNEEACQVVGGKVVESDHSCKILISNGNKNPNTGKDGFYLVFPLSKAHDKYVEFTKGQGYFHPHYQGGRVIPHKDWGESGRTDEM